MDIFILIGAIIFIFYNIFKKKYIFKIKVHYKLIKIIYGKPPLKFIEECKKATKFHKPKKGYIYGINENGTIKIEFSKQFDTKKEQVFRNIWTEYPAIKQKKGKRKKS